ncbi:MAG: hypothetical protein WDL87_06505 [Candidatus Omnitrophota bacterium]|jgi:hypothetical protein
MAHKKVIYITIFALTPQIERYLLIQDVLDAGIPVEYWDLKGIYFKGRHFKNTLSREYVKEINSFDELKVRLKNEDLKSTVFVLQVYFGWQVISLYLLMTRLRCKTVYFPWVAYAREDLTTKIIDKIRPAVFFQTFLNLIANVCKRAGLIRKYDLVFVAGRLTGDAFKDHFHVVNINYQDYDYYQLTKNMSQRVVAGEYCVFLDEGPVYNDDVSLLNMQQLDFIKFYESLNNFFSVIEKSFKVKVVIAAHPGITYEKNIFKGRLSYEGKTCELVKDSRFVISQSSTSTSYAVLYRKPIIFVYTQEYRVKRKANFRTLEFLSKSLGSKAYNIDSEECIKTLQVPAVNAVLYDKYKYSCLTSKESENRFSKDIVVQALRES